jgi:hypothetical protein
MSSSTYLLAGQVSELDRLQLQSRVWEPSGRCTVVVEDPDWGSWHFNPPARACEKLIDLIQEAFARWGDAMAGRKHVDILRSVDVTADVRAEVLALPEGHPHLRLPLQFTTALEARLLSFVEGGELAQLRKEAEAELREPGRWGITFTLLQTWGRRAP